MTPEQLGYIKNSLLGNMAYPTNPYLGPGGMPNIPAVPIPFQNNPTNLERLRDTQAEMANPIGKVPVEAGLQNLAGSLLGLGLDAGEAGQRASQALGDAFTKEITAEDVYGQPQTPGFDPRMIVDEYLMNQMGPQGMQRSTIATLPARTEPPVPQRPEAQGVDMSEYFRILDRARPQQPDAARQDEIRETAILQALGQGLSGIARAQTGQELMATLGGAALQGYAGGRQAVLESVQGYENDMRRMDLLLAEGKLQEAQDMARTANENLDRAWEQQLREYEQRIRLDDANNTQIVSTAGGRLVMQERGPDGQLQINSYSWPSVRQRQNLGRALGGGGAQGKINDAMSLVNARFPGERMGIVLDQFMSRVGEAGLVQLFGAENIEELNDRALEATNVAAGSITDEKHRNQIYQDARMQDVWNKMAANPDIAIQMIRMMEGINN